MTQLNDIQPKAWVSEMELARLKHLGMAIVPKEPKYAAQNIGLYTHADLQAAYNMGRAAGLFEMGCRSMMGEPG